MKYEESRRIFASNRAEEIGHDVWKEFVILPSYESLGIGHTQKPRVIVGGRGCGKTMLLRYLSHESTFSVNRYDYPPDALRHIGLYWKADTQFASMLEKRGQDQDTWRAAFDHLAALVLSIEVLRSLTSISNSKLDLVHCDRLGELDFRRFKVFSARQPATYHDLVEHLEDRLADFEQWANDIRSVERPSFLPGSKFIKRLIGTIQRQIPEMGNSVFSVYIDEYENLSLYQQRMINTWLKHSEQPLIFNLAMKRNGFKTRDTEGDETLSDIHDYRTVDLEEFRTDDQFALFAAEILLSRLLMFDHMVLDTEVDLLGILRDPSGLELRRRRKAQIFEAAKALLPSPSQRAMALRAFRESSIRTKLKSRIEKALRRRRLSTKTSDNFMDPNFPEASIIIPALLSRRTLSVEDIEKQLESLRSEEENKFTGRTNWIHNNFYGCFLQLYDGLVRPCPIYSGFGTFCKLARGNLRHFLELCHQAWNRSRDGLTVSPEMQSEAARQVSSDFLGEVRSFGHQGNNLHAFLLRLGTLFSLSQQSVTQSEPERTHFAIKEGLASMPGNEISFISEAIKWSVISEKKGTKKKTSSDPENLEYIINPIYAPYFHISYRRRRKLELSREEVEVLIVGSYQAIRRLFSVYQQKWLVELEDAPLPLFAHLDEGNYS